MWGSPPRRTRYAGSAPVELVARRRYKKGGGSAPDAVDPVALGEAQKNANIETAKVQSQLSNVNTTSPLGTTIFTPGANNQWNLAQTLTPALQNVLYGQQNLATTLPDVANRIGQFLTEPGQAGIRLAQNAANIIGPQAWGSARPDLQGSLDFSKFGALPTSNLQTGLDFSKLGRLSYDPAEFDRQIGRAENAAYRSQTQFLDPQFAQQRDDLRQQLADEGIPRGGEAFSRSTGDLGRQQEFAYRGARNAATAAGQEEQARLFGQQLAGRGQGAQELQAGGAFRNAAEQQRFGDILAARGIGTGEEQALANFRNQVAQQQWQNPQQALASLLSSGSGLYGSAAQDLTTLSPLSGFEWAGSLPTFGGSPTAVSPANIVGAQTAANNAAANRFAANQTMNNTLWNGLGTLGGAAGNALGLKSGWLGNMFGGLFGSGAGAGAGAGFASGLGALAAPVAADAAWATPELLSMIGILSDPIAKDDHGVVGTLDNGLPIHLFNYKGDTRPQIGLMADEVERVNPDAVRMAPTGFRMVNYAEAAKGSQRG